MPGKKLLVADDSLTIQKVIRLALSNEGYDIQTVSEGNDAIQQIAVFRPDVILIDVSLPGKSAFEVKRAINQLADLENVRFILMSSAFETVDEPQVKEVRFQGRLTKPFDPAHLRQILTDVLAGSFESAPPDERIVSKNTSNSQDDPSDPLFQAEEELQVVSPPPVSEAITSLWEANQGALGSQAHPDEYTQPSSPSDEYTLNESSSESDITQLTQTTIRNLHPEEDFQWSVNEPKTRPLERMLDKGASSFSFDSPSELEEEPFSPPPISEQISLTADEEITSLSKEQIEAIINSHLQTTFQKMVEKMMPEIAERVIKQEILKLLSD